MPPLYPWRLDACRIALGADQHEIIVHHWVALHPEAVGDEFLLLRPCVDEDDIGVAAPCGLECLSRSLRDHLDIDAGLLLEEWQKITKQAGVLVEVVEATTIDLS